MVLFDTGALVYYESEAIFGSNDPIIKGQIQLTKDAIVKKLDNISLRIDN